MYRHEIVWSSTPSHIRLRGCTSELAPVDVPSRSPIEPVAASFPDEAGKPVSTAGPPPPDLRPLLQTIAESLETIDQRRQQSLLEMQQVAIELAVAVASQLVFQAIDSEHFAVEKLVHRAIESMGIGAIPVISLHPQDLELLQKRLTQEPAPWSSEQITFHSDPGVSRGGCRVENEAGRMLVSDIGLQLSEIRRHWMEELDDSQVERRKTSGEVAALRRFPDRREIA